MFFNKTIYEVEKCSLIPNLGLPHDDLDLKMKLAGEASDLEVVFFDSGKAALFYCLEYFKSKGMISNKNDELLVPAWIGSWVHNISQKLIFPSLEYSARCRGVLVYHQYGYTQNMDEILTFAKANELFIIEDFAHALFSRNNSNLIELKGDVGIFSFSKFFPTPMGGGIITRDKELYLYLKSKSKKHNRFIQFLSYETKKLISSNVNFFRNSHFLHLLNEMCYAVYDRSSQVNPKTMRVIRKQFDQHFKIRRDNYLKVVSSVGKSHFPINTSNYFAPYVLPLLASEDKLRCIKDKLEQVDISTGIYSFDLNQNILNPNFVKCLWIPVHPGVGKDKLELIITILKEVV